MTRLSVAIANYNHGYLLKERLSSILEQLSEEDEIVIVDDASTDDSVAIIEEMAIQDRRLQLLRNPQNRGVVKSANRAMKACRGIYIISMSSDDRILPGFIEKTMAVLFSHPEIPLACSDCAMSYVGFPDKDPEKIYTATLIQEAKEVLVFFPRDMVSLFRTTISFWIPGHTAILRRDLLEKYGYLDESLGYLCDWFLLHQIGVKYGVAYIPQSLSVWRQEQKSYSLARHEDMQYKAELHFKLIQAMARSPHRLLFHRSRLAHYYTRICFWRLMKMPQYWDFSFLFALRVIRNRIKKFARV